MITSCKKDPDKGLYGCWKVYKHTMVNGITCLDQQEHARLVGYLMDKEFVLTKDYMILNGTRYKYPIYKIREENANIYFFDYYRIPDKTVLGIKKNTDKIKVLKIYVVNREKEECVEMNWSGCAHLYFDELVFYNNELILNYEVEFFHLKKAK